MNKRIRELAEQTELNATLLFNKEKLEKFALLIVEECIRVSESHAKSLEAQQCDPTLEAYEDGIVNGIYEAAEAIKEHFGLDS
jgi:hypothetical protein